MGPWASSRLWEVGSELGRQRCLLTPLCPQISQVLGNEIKFAVREPLGLR